RWPPGTVESSTYSGTPGTTSGRSALDTPKPIVPVTTLPGGPDRAGNTASTGHPLATVCHADPGGAAGNAYVTPPLKVWRTSKSEGPQSCSGSTLKEGNTGIVSFEMLSIECANVYEASACKPLESRWTYFTCSASYRECPWLVMSVNCWNCGVGSSSCSCRSSRRPRAPIRHRHRACRSQRLLDGDIPLMGVRQLEVGIRGREKVHRRARCDGRWRQQSGIRRERDTQEQPPRRERERRGQLVRDGAGAEIAEHAPPASQHRLTASALAQAIRRAKARCDVVVRRLVHRRTGRGQRKRRRICARQR